MRKLTILLLLAALIAGCQVETQLPPAPTTPSTITPAATKAQTPTATQIVPGSTRTPLSRIPITPDELKGVRVQFWYPWSGELARVVDAAVSEFNLTNIWGITVIATGQGSILALDNTVSSAAAGSPLPQVIAIPPEYIANYPDAVPLDDYLQDPQWGLTSQEEADFYPSFWNEGQTVSPRYSIPLLRSMAVLYYNQGWAKELGFTHAPSTPVDFKTQICAAGKSVAATGNPETNGTGGWIVNTSSSTIYSWLVAYGAVPSLSPSAVQLYDNNNADVAFTYLRKLDDANCAWVSRNPTPYTYFAGRQALFFSGTLEDLLALSAAMAYQKNNDGWTVLPYPTDNPQKTLVTFGTSLGILKSSPQEQLASWLFVRWMELPRVQARLAAAGPSLPVRKSAMDLVGDFAKANPQWAIAAGWLKGQTQSLPVQAWWKITQRVLEDGAGQVFQPFLTVDKVPDVLKELDATVAELLNKK